MGIELKAVTKRVGANMHIYTTDLVLEKGGFNVLLGTTLSGKTTLMRLMAGLEAPTSGEVWFDNVNVTGVPVQKRQVAMVYQAFINYPSYTVFDNIASPLRVAGLGKEEITRRVGEIADLLKLTPMLDRLPAEISGGQQQRTALGRALIKNAPLVLLDEPLANLDYKLREELRDELPKLFEHTGATVVYATSEPQEALMLGGHTATVHEGRISQHGITAEVFRKPRNLLTARVFSDPPINTATVDKKGDSFVLNEQIRWPVSAKYAGMADGSYSLAVHPHHVTLNQLDASGVAIGGVVQVAEISGSESIVHVNIAGNPWVSETQGVHPFVVGDQTELFMQAERCLYFSDNGELVAS